MSSFTRDPEIVDLFASSVESVIATMATLPLRWGAPQLKKGQNTFGAVTAVVGFAGESNATSAIMTLSFEEPLLLAIFSQMLGQEISTIDDDVLDAAGELTNIVCGDVKRRLSEMNVTIGMALPIVLAGSPITIRNRATRRTLVIPFAGQAGRMVLETNFQFENQR